MSWKTILKITFWSGAALGGVTGSIATLTTQSVAKRIRRHREAKKDREEDRSMGDVSPDRGGSPHGGDGTTAGSQFEGPPTTGRPIRDPSRSDPGTTSP
jgi:hypothetical protein